MTIIISRENGWLIIDRKKKDMLLHIFSQDGNNLKAIYIFYPDEGIISQRNDMILLKKKKNSERKCNQHNQWNLYTTEI